MAANHQDDPQCFARPLSMPLCNYLPRISGLIYILFTYYYIKCYQNYVALSKMYFYPWVSVGQEPGHSLGGPSASESVTNLIQVLVRAMISFKGSTLEKDNSEITHRMTGMTHFLKGCWIEAISSFLILPSFPCQ